jgi:drug/metabolite transporter (DMT)-like permease
VTRYKKNNLHGISLMILGMFLISVMDGLAKWLVLADVSVVQILAVRSWLILTMILLLTGLRGQWQELRPSRPLHHGLRGVAAFFAPFSFFLALKTLPLADASVVFFSNTFIVTAASALLLKEKVGKHRWAAVVVGFIGVVIAINPEGSGELTAYLLVITGTAVYAMAFIAGKHLSRTDSVLSLVFSLNLGMGVVATAMLPWFWTPISTQTLVEIFVMSLFAVTGHFAIASAFARAEVSAIAPFEYTALIWLVIIGYLVWQDIPSLRVWTGAFVIVASGIYVIHRESLRRTTE